MKNSHFVQKVKKKFEWVIFLILIMAIAGYISAFHYQLLMIQGNSMLPCFHHLQIVVLDKQSKEFNYGDVIAFQCDGLDAVLVKRIVACPGDTVCIEGGILSVNGKVSEVYGKDVVFEYAGIIENELLIADEHYFVIGDNVAKSMDSRYEKVGVIKMSNIQGKVLEQQKAGASIEK